MATYEFKTIEDKWQAEWERRKSWVAPTPTKERPPYFMLVMFPYPSGNLHMGHVRNYTIGDVLARFHRRRGRSVLHPIGWDAFGLPAENAAIKHGVPPAKWTGENITVMRGQLKKLAISYDWDREIATCDPTYYRWNQWIFIKMFEKGLAFRKKAPVNWCNTCGTVLANEQVHDGKCWRCGNPVEQKELEQWFFRITDYAEELLTGHDQLRPSDKAKGWPEQVLAMQANWIGRSWGAHADFAALDAAQKPTGDPIRVFTTRPDTLFGATFLVLAPEHPLVDKLTAASQRPQVEAYRAAAKKLSRIARTAEGREKSGVFSGAYARNPVNGQAIPIWIADYVLTDYGTGAIMAVPAHDQRDYDFAKAFGLPVVQVVRPRDGKMPTDQAFEADGTLINSGPFDGADTDDAKKRVAEFLKEKNLGGPTVTYKLRDWLLSRQRYWGTPIPIVYCQACGAVPVKTSDLPVTLPTNVTFTGQGASPLTQATDWLSVPCPKCGKPGRRETDTMDTFVDSSWYYARYTDPKNTTAPFDPAKANPWLPVAQYVGGVEHATMHLIYSRFFHKVFRDMGMVSTDEPFGSLMTQGMVTLGGSAMSKSKGNVVDPNEVIRNYGADTCRVFILFAAPPTQQLEWSDKQIEGIWRFLNRVWRLAQAFGQDDEARALKRTGTDEASGNTIGEEELVRETNVAIQRVTTDIDRDFGFNTAIAALMELVNAIYRYPPLGDAPSRAAVETVLHLLAPFAPHLTEEAWQRMGHSTLLSEEPWPVVDASKLVASTVEIVVQVNGKVRERLTVPADAAEEDVRARALESLEKRGVRVTPQRIIYVPKKLVNFVGRQEAAN